ncbi:hypothetical protein PsAD13_00893 [Pseudovibrio sp. Ad13]|nr:hypothetical protein PsAD13_00893 [Pseudovibrio sp. Ad13]KZK94630.1 hypothetical protein PsAD46_00911 [Pseudovibrio sp. Ad46]KZL01515.1 hypothetical protein PsAD5_00435 [Pseudovibrio sp. Ad5]
MLQADLGTFEQECIKCELLTNSGGMSWLDARRVIYEIFCALKVR